MNNIAEKSFLSGPKTDGGEAAANQIIDRQLSCQHDYTATFNGGDTYRCRKCKKEIDMTEDDTDEL